MHGTAIDKHLHPPVAPFDSDQILMDPRGRRFARFAISMVIALLPTFALLFVMTILINPLSGHLPLAPVSMSIHYQSRAPAVKDDEVHRMDETTALRDSAPTKPIDDQPQQLITTKRDEKVDATRADSQAPRQRIDRSVRSPIDWREEGRRVVQETGEVESAKAWRLAQGYDEYVSIIQGPPRTAMKIPMSSFSNEEDKLFGYNNVYGELEVKISDNCVAQSNERHDGLDFTGVLPATIFCKSPRPDISVNQRQFLQANIAGSESETLVGY